ncbi:MAG: LarC family nickel insertion protein, partial [Tepidiformaceae bacterium]
MPEHRRAAGKAPKEHGRKVRTSPLPTDAGRGPSSEAADLEFAREFGAAGHSPATARQNVLVFDSFSGIAGDMTIAALIDAGAPVEGIREGLAKLPIPSFTLDTVAVVRGGLNARHLELEIAQEQTYQPAEMRAIIRDGTLPARAERRALAAIDALERAEAAAHQTETPHFHEAGGVDAIIDLCGSMVALELLDIEQCWCPVVTVGAGTIVKTEHGPIPAAPGPAAAYILQEAGFALRFVESSHELVTPTGAAILAAVARPGPVVMTPTAHGAGAGTFDPVNRPNALRVFIGHPTAIAATRKIVELSANIDDMPASLLAHARDRLMEEGALDAWL